MRTRNMRIIPAFAVGLGLSLFGIARGQDTEQRVKLKDLPQAVQKTVQEQSQGATIKGFSKEIERGQTFYEVELKVAGHGKDVLIDPSGRVVEIEEEVALSALPSDVKAGILQHAGKGKVLKVESITKDNAIVMYEAVVRKAGKKSEIKVGPDGQLLPNN